MFLIVSKRVEGAIRRVAGQTLVSSSWRIFKKIKGMLLDAVRKLMI